MDELWLNNGKLIEESEWIKDLTKLKSTVEFQDKLTAKEELKKTIITAIKNRCPKSKFGIFFSGGVDSSLISALGQKLNQDFICYTVGFQDEKTTEPEDIIEAKKVAKQLGFKLKYKIYNLTETEKIIEKTTRLLRTVKKDDVVNVGVGSVIVAAVELAQKDKMNYFFSGLGSEEIFAGYDRHSKAEDINQECWKGLFNMWSRDLMRDFTLSQEFKFTLKTPFLDSKLINLAMKLPGNWKLNKTEKKIILREIAQEYLGEYAWRKKTAAQYGSCFDKAIQKLAKKQGFKLKKEYL